MSSTLTIGGTAYDQSGRRAANYLVDGWGWDVDSGYYLEFHEHTSGPQPRIAGPKSVSLSVGGTTVFSGDLVSAVPAIDGSGRRTWGYRCLGLEYRAGWIPVTANDGSGVIRFNVSPTNQDYYVASMAGQTVGQILDYCFSQHSSALSAAGITTDATTSSGTAALTLVPSAEVQIAGERLWPALTDFLRQYARNIRLVITGAGLIRVVDLTAGTAHTLTLGTDPVDPPLFSRNWTSCATKVTVRGAGTIEPGYVSVLGGSLTPAWSSANQSAWTYADFTNPVGASTDSGTVSSVSSSTTIVVSSSNASRTWAANYWNGIQAWIYLTKTTGLGLTYTEARPVTACTALSAGGTATITVAYALQNSATDAYDGYKLIGTNVPLGGGGLYDVWRLYDVTDPGSQIKNHLVPSFPTEVAFLGYNGQSATLATSPTAMVLGSTEGITAPFTVLPETGQILFVRPVVEYINSTSDLDAGTFSTPTDVYACLAYSRGALTTSYPASGYAGTAYSVAGLQRTQTVDVYDWRYGGNAAPLNDLARMLCVSVSNTLVEGNVTYRGLWTAPQDPTGGHKLNVAGNGYTTGDESLGIPIRGYSVRYMAEGGGLNYVTQLRCSTRQEPRTAEGQYVHLSVLGGGYQWAGGQPIGAPPPSGLPGVFGGFAAAQAPAGFDPYAQAAGGLDAIYGGAASWLGSMMSGAASWLGIGGDGDRPRRRRRRESLSGDASVLSRAQGLRPTPAVDRTPTVGPADVSGLFADADDSFPAPPLDEPPAVAAAPPPPPRPSPPPAPSMPPIGPAVASADAPAIDPAGLRSSIDRLDLGGGDGPAPFTPTELPE